MKARAGPVVLLILVGAVGTLLGLLIGSRDVPKRLYNRLVHSMRNPFTVSTQSADLFSEAWALSDQPIPIIFDTDIGNDVDDVLALALLHELADRGEVEILAVTISKDNPWCAPHVDLINTFYGRPDIPIGIVKDGTSHDDGKFNRQVVSGQIEGCSAHPHHLRYGDPVPDATVLLRGILSEQPDEEVVFVSVGFLTNAANLLESEPDQHTPLSGSELISKKIRLYVAMAGAFNANPEPEYNVRMDQQAARIVFNDWPTPIIASGYEIGLAIKYPAASILRDFTYDPCHPVTAAYRAYLPMPYDRPTWDLTALLYAARPGHNYFRATNPGQISLDEDGITRFSADSEGRHHYLTVRKADISRVREVFETLVSSPPLR